MENRDFSKPKTPSEFLRIYLSGAAMGAADIVPGVSGGTMAFILGIYETLLNAIKSFNLDAIRMALKFDFKSLFAHIPLGFLMALGLGIGTSILVMSSLLHDWLEHYPTFVFAFFGGLIIASIVAIGAKIKWNGASLMALVIAAIGAFILVGLAPSENADHGPITLFLSGTVAIMAMILPGISGSFILLLLGQYQFVLSAVKSLDIVSIGSLALGCVVGILGFSRILSWLLRHHENVTVATLVGFMIGSLRTIWDRALTVTPESRLQVIGTSEILIMLALVAAGFVIVSVLDHLQSGRNPILKWLWKPAQQKAVVTE
jgi:putative membrane protein